MRMHACMRGRKFSPPLFPLRLILSSTLFLPSLAHVHVRGRSRFLSSLPIFFFSCALACSCVRGRRKRFLPSLFSSSSSSLSFLPQHLMLSIEWKKFSFHHAFFFPFSMSLPDPSFSLPVSPFLEHSSSLLFPFLFFFPNLPFVIDIFSPFYISFTRGRKEFFSLSPHFFIRFEISLHPLLSASLLAT